MIRRYTVVVLGAILTFGTFVTWPQTPSTPGERKRFVEVAHKLEQSPLDEGLRSEREWALKWLIQVPDVHVELCSNALGPYLREKFKRSPEITLQLTLSSGAFVIEHPEQATDKVAQNVAGVEGALKAYQAILKQEPKSKSRALDDLLEKQSKGELADTVAKNVEKGCKSN